MSTRSLTIIVAAFALVGFVLLIALTVTLLLESGLPPLTLQPTTPIPTTLPAASGSSWQDSRTAIQDNRQQGWAENGTFPTPSPLMAKPVAAAGNVGPRWTATPAPTPTPTPSPTPNPTFVSSAYGLGSYMPDGISPEERWIDVNVTEQRLVAYQGYVPVFEALVSTGTARHPTVTGQFRIWLRFRSQDMNGYRLGYDYYLKGVPYVQYFYEDYALHGTFWHSNFGTPMSHGCVNLSPSDAEWLYSWAGYGTLVNVHP